MDRNSAFLNRHKCVLSTILFLINDMCIIYNKQFNYICYECFLWNCLCIMHTLFNSNERFNFAEMAGNARLCRLVVACYSLLLLSAPPACAQALGVSCEHPYYGLLGSIASTLTTGSWGKLRAPLLQALGLSCEHPYYRLLGSIASTITTGSWGNLQAPLLQALGEIYEHSYYRLLGSVTSTLNTGSWGNLRAPLLQVLGVICELPYYILLG